MGSLSNLYISQSYVSLIHLGSDSFITTQSVELQDGLGNGLGIFVNSLGDVNIQGAFSASNIPSDIASQAELNAYTASTNIRLNNIETTTASLNSSVSQLNASSASQQVSINALNSYTQSTNVRLNSLEAATSSYANSASVAAVDAAQQQSINSLNSVTASFLTSSTDISALNAFTASQISFNSSATASISQLLSFSSSLDTNFVTEGELASATGSLISQINTKLNTSSFNAYTQSNNQRVNSLETNSASVNISINNLNSTTASQATSISNLNSATASLFTSASLALVTASFNNGTRNLTFIKGDNTTFNVNIPDASGSTGDFVTTASFNQYTQSNDQRVSSLETNSASVNISISSLNTFTASQSTASLVNSINELNQFTSSTNVRLNNIETTTASLNTFSASALISISNLNQSSASQQVSINALNTFTASQSTASIDNSITNLNQFTQSANVRLNNLESTSASVNTSISNINGFTSSANQRLTAIETVSGSWITESETASFARTNVDNNFTANQTFTNITAVSASFTYVQTTYETSSVIYSSGSNQFGDELTDTQTLSGSVKVQGSLTVNGTPVQTSSFDPSALNQATASLQAFTQSAEVRLNNIESTTASLNTSVSNLNTFSASTLVSISNLNASSASQQVSIDALNVFTASQSTASIVTSINELNTFTSSTNVRLNNIESTTASLLVETYNLELFSASALTSLSNLNTATASLFTSASLALTTASISGDILTFTKGDASTFSVTFPTGSGALPAGLLSSSVTNFVDYSASVDSRINNIVTGTGFATTGSNQFNGTQVITGSMTSSLDIRVAGVPMGFGNPSGTSSIAIGVSTLLSNTGNSNIAIGTRASQQNTTGAGNIAIALDALQRNTTGNQNIGIGEAALRENRTGNGNIVIGHNAAINAGNVLGNTIVGKGAAQTVKNNYNTIVGETAALNITSGSNNTIVGQAAGVDIGSGSNNIFIGQNAGRLISGSNNTLVGSAQGVGNWSNVIAISDGQQNIRALFSGSEWDLTGSLDVSGSFTASLQQGHLYVGNANGRTTTIATSSLVVSIDTGSLVTTASFNSYTSSNNQRVSSLEANSASVNTSISNLNANSASQQVSIDALNVFTASQSTASIVNSINELNTFTASANIRLNNLESTTASLLIQTANLETFSASALVSINALNAATNSYVTETESGSFLITASFASQTLTFTKGDNTTFSVTIPDVSGSTIDTASFATTGSNTFTGDQTFTDASGNFFTITDTSGSMMLVAKGFTSASAHITSSAANKVNIIFKNNNNTATTYLSGSNNIFVNTEAPTSGFKRIIGSSNINLFQALPQVSASMGDYVNIDNNFITARNTSPMTMRGPVSSSAWEIKGNTITQQLNIGTSAANHAQGLVSGLFVNNCYIGATLAIVANRSNTTQQTSITNNNLAGAVTLNMNSSSIDFMNNTTAGGTLTINNNTTGSARATTLNNSVFISSNILGGNTTMTLSGSNDPNDAQDIDYNGGVVRNLIHGSGNAIRVNTGLTGSNTLAGTAIVGNNLIVTGSSQNPLTNNGTNLGSAFFGRYNSVDGNKALSSETVFAIGAGSPATSRKTPLRVSSSAMVLFEGETNFSGNITFTDRSGYNNNVYLGSDALGMGTSGAQPLAFGNTIAVAIGNGAMRYASGSNQNVAIGNNALLITTGSKNVAIGSEALSDNTTGAQNFAFGVSALTSNTTGQDNVAIGSNAIFNHTIGSGQVAIGNNALQAMTNDAGTNGQNMAIGGDAMANVITASLNVAIGAGALRDVRYANENVFIGHNSGINTSGSIVSNTVIGGRAGEKMAGNDNTIIGHSAGGALVNGASNTFIGKNAGLSVITGSYNTLIGGTLSGQNNWNNVIAISDGLANIKFFNSGSQTTLTNNTLISGSLTVTGSTVLSGSFYIQSGSNLPNGTTERVLTYDTTTGQVRQATLASILSASFDAAEFWSTTTQSGSAGVSGSITFNNSGSVAGVSLVNNTQVTVSQAGTYNIQFSAQIETSAGADTVHIWFKKNGTNIAASASKALLANNTAQIMTVNLFDEAVANDYYELAYQTTNGNATVLAEVASGNIPAIPSVILTIQQIR